MPVESASFVQNLNENNPTTSDDVSQGDNHLRLIKSALKATFPTANRALYMQGVLTNVASSSTTDIGAAASDNLTITGTTTITGFGTVVAGTYRQGRFSGSLTLTHSEGVLDLPGGANIQTAAGDKFGAVSLGDGNWMVLWFQRASGKALVAPLISEITDLESELALLSAAVPVGKVEFWPGAVIPNGWITAHGQAISRTTYADLFAAYGVVHGAGDSTTTFNVIDMRGVVPGGLDNMGGTSANRITAEEADTLGARLGSETVELELENVPLHGHPYRIGTPSDTNTPALGFSSTDNTRFNRPAFDGTPSDAEGEQIGGAGGDEDGDTVPHANVQPTIFGNWIIWTGVLSEE